jgi:hypothetical protein
LLVSIAMIAQSARDSWSELLTSFALGALSHYAADIAGHPAVNQSVAIEFPKLRAKYGKSVRYAQDKTAHLKTEFGPILHLEAGYIHADYPFDQLQTPCSSAADHTFEWNGDFSPTIRLCGLVPPSRRELFLFRLPPLR